MGLYTCLLKEHEEEEGSRASLSRSEDMGSTVFASGPGSTFEDRSQDQRRTDIRRLRSYLSHGVTNRWEAAHLATLKRKYADEYWDIRYGRL
jgi:hypothetical protein